MDIKIVKAGIQCKFSKAVENTLSKKKTRARQKYQVKVVTSSCAKAPEQYGWTAAVWCFAQRICSINSISEDRHRMDTLNFWKPELPWLRVGGDCFYLASISMDTGDTSQRESVKNMAKKKPSCWQCSVLLGGLHLHTICTKRPKGGCSRLTQWAFAGTANKNPQTHERMRIILFGIRKTVEEGPLGHQIQSLSSFSVSALFSIKLLFSLLLKVRVCSNIVINLSVLQCVLTTDSGKKCGKNASNENSLHLMCA